MLPYIKGLPVIITAVALALFFSTRYLRYTTPLFESTAKLKLDDHDLGFGASNLYRDFDVFTQSNHIQTEVEVLRSAAVLDQALELVPFGISYFRKGQLHDQELYGDSPFLVKIDSSVSFLDKSQTLQIRVISNEKFEVRLAENQSMPDLEGRFDEWLVAPGLRFQLQRNEAFLATRKNYHLLDDYYFTVHSKASLLRHFSDQLDVVPVDKDIAVVQLSIREAVPQKAADFVNAVAETYVNDYVQVRSDAANRTTGFIDKQLAETAKKLENAEYALEHYRLQNKIINTRQETETGLRKLAQLKLQLVNLEMREAALDSLNQYLDQEDREIGQLAPQFDAFGDLLFTELMKKLKRLEDEKKDLSLRYTNDHEFITVVDDKITDILNYLREGIANSLRDIRFQRSEIEKTIAIASTEFDDLPTKEKELIVLEREFQLQQNLYRFLSEKRSEASIATAANLSFHRIIEPALASEKPVTPVGALIYGVSVFLSLLVSIGFIALRQALRQSPKSRESLERLSALSVLGIVRDLSKQANEAEEEFAQLAASLRFRGRVEQSAVVAVTSSVNGEGKTSIAQGLAEAYTREGKKVLLVDCNLRQSTEKALYPNLAQVLLETAQAELPISIKNGVHRLPAGLAEGSPLTLLTEDRLGSWLQQWRSEFDLILLDTPATVSVPDTIGLMRMADTTLYVLRAGKTPSSVAMQPDLLCEEYALENVHLVLNGVHRATSYNGRFVSSSYRVHRPFATWRGQLGHYLNTYLR